MTHPDLSDGSLGIEEIRRRLRVSPADADRLLEHMGRPGYWRIAHANELPPDELREFHALCERRAAGEPLEYITGKAVFFGRTFFVDERVLVPRPETELLVREATAFLRDRENVRVLDVGTGSGAIACTIALEIPGAFVTGTDCSADALEVARANARALGVNDRCTFVLADLVPGAVFDQASGSSAHGDVERYDEPPAYDVIVANLPYIPTRDLPQKPNPVGFEPVIATDGGVDGLTQYRKLVGQIPGLLRPNGVALFEAAPATLGPLHELCAEALPQARITAHRDAAGLERYLILLSP